MAVSNALTILAFDGPIFRAYVSALQHQGIRPRRVVTLVPRYAPSTGEEVGRWLPRAMRGIYAAHVNDARQNYWPRRLKRTEPALVRGMRERLAARFPFFEHYFQNLERRSRYEGWAEAHEVVLVDHLADPALANVLAGAGTVLFTGGGIVPASLLAMLGLRFIHVHPGILPHVRGADGLLWSMLVRGRPGRTAFVMTSILDNGPIIQAEEVEPLRFDISGHARPNDQVLYRALYSYYDPCLRAELMANVMANGNWLSDQGQKPPSGNQGALFPFMSNRLRTAALGYMFQSV